MMAMAGSRLGWYQAWVRFVRPEAKKADSMFSRKFTAPKEAKAVGEMCEGGGPFGGAPPASVIVCWDWSRGRTRALVERAKERVVRRVVGCMIGWFG